jgi:hypothetical protein
MQYPKVYIYQVLSHKHKTNKSKAITSILTTKRSGERGANTIKGGTVMLLNRRDSAHPKAVTETPSPTQGAINVPNKICCLQWGGVINSMHRCSLDLASPKSQKQRHSHIIMHVQYPLPKQSRTTPSSTPYPFKGTLHFRALAPAPQALLVLNFQRFPCRTILRKPPRTSKSTNLARRSRRSLIFLPASLLDVLCMKINQLEEILCVLTATFEGLL